MQVTNGNVTVDLSYKITSELQKKLAILGEPAHLHRTVPVTLPLEEALKLGMVWIDRDGVVVPTTKTSIGGASRVNTLDTISYVFVYPTSTEPTEKTEETEYEHCPTPASALTTYRAIRYGALDEYARLMKDEAPARKAAEEKRLAEAHAANTEKDRRDKAYREDQESKKAAQEAKKAEQKASEIAAAPAWIEAQGSERLKLALAADMIGSCLALYRRERLDHARPGWIFEPKNCDETEEVYSPEQHHLESLIQEKKFFPNTRLTKFNVEDDKDEDEKWVWTWALADDFEGRSIVKFFTR